MGQSKFMRGLYAGGAEIALIVVLLVTGNALLALIVFLFLIPTVEYIRRQR